MRKRADDPIENERRALVEQRQELAALQRQLAERVNAVKEREAELRSAVTRTRPGTVIPSDPSGTVLPPLAGEGGRAELDDRARALDAREQAIATREEALATRTARLGSNPDEDTDENALDAQRRLTQLEQQVAAAGEREAALNKQLAALRAEADARPELPPTPAEQSAEQEAKIEARLAELRAVEKAFERTRDELTARSEAIAARERLVSERERELSDGWGANVEMHELESRLRRLEQQKGTTQPAGFSSGVRKLEQQGKRGKQAS